MVDKSDVDSKMRTLFRFLLHNGDHVEAAPTVIVKRAALESSLVLKLESILCNGPGSREVAHRINEYRSNLN